MSEVWTDDDARAAVEALSVELVEALAQGPLDDPEDCRICEVFDPWLFGHGPGTVWAEDEGGDSYVVSFGPDHDPVTLLIAYHRDQAEWGTGSEAFRRCQVVYEAARSVRSDRHTPCDEPSDSAGRNVADDRPR